jgi:ABC-type transport system substrate-binding protein
VKARKLFREAGYPDGKNFPALTLQTNNGGGDRNITVAEAVVNMLKENLGINVSVETMPFAEHLETVGRGKVSFWRSGWVGDYADPAVFLNLAYGKNIPVDPAAVSYLNASRFHNAQFDELFEKGNAETDQAVRMEDYRQAETIAMQNAFILPLYFETNTQLIGMKVMNYHLNALDLRDLSEVYFGE